MRTQRGMGLVELTVGMVVLSIVGAAMWSILQITFRMHDVVIGQNNSFAETRKGLDLVADHLRNAQLNTNTGSGVTYSAIKEGSISDVTYYTDTGTAVVPTELRLRLHNGNIEFINGGTTTILATNISSLTLTYYTLTTYNGNWSATADRNAPTTAELPRIGGMEIKVEVAMDGYTTEYKTVVRLRNSPRKTAISGI